MQKNTETPLNARVAPPSEPACFQNPVFKQCIEDIFSIFVSYSANVSIFVSGGCLSRTYLDTCMSEGHKSSFGDIDFKVPNCSQDELWWFASNYNKFTDEQLFCPSPLVAAFNALLYYGGILEKVYYKGNDASARLVINIKWRGVAVDFVLFSETLLEHAMKVDLSVSAGFYNPVWSEIFFPCDRFLENNQYGLRVPCDRSAKDFMNKELNLVFPERFWDVFDEDPIRILRIVQALSRSDYTLSTVLRQSITNYLCSRRETVFSKVNPDRLYYNLKSLFFSGHAVKNLNTLMELNLLEVLFLNLSHLLPEAKEIVFHLITCVATESDNNYLLSPSLLFYAVYWETIKDKSYDQNVIFELSEGKIRLPVSNNGLHEKEIFNETVHNKNIEYLQKCEREYENNQTCRQLLGDKTEADVLFFGDLDNPISVVVSSSPIPAAENILFDVNDLSFPELIIAFPQHDTHTYTQSDNDLPHELESVETKKSASAVASPDATEPRPLGSENPRAFAPGSESTDEAMTKTQKSNNKNGKKSTKENKADNPLIVDEYSIYKERCQQAIALLDSKKYKEAEKVFRQAIRLNSTWPDAHCGLGQLRQKLAEEYNAAISSFFRQFQLLKEDSKQNKKAIENCIKEHTMCLQKQNERYREAIDYYQQALANDPDYNQAAVFLEKIASVKQSEPISVPKDRSTSVSSKKPVKNKGKSSGSSKAQKSPIPAIANNTVDPCKPQQKRNQDLLRRAQQEEDAGNDLKAIECYKHLFTQSHSLASGYKCIFLYKKLGRYQDALKYATKLIAISEKEHSRVYDNQSISDDKPLDNYQYHHCYALYQRGKLHLKLKNSREATVDFDSMLSAKEEDNFNVSLIDIVISSYIKLGQHYCSLAYESPMILRIHYVSCMQQRYERVYNLIKLLGIVNHDRLSEIYLGFGDVERFKNNFNEASVYYEKALEVINANIDNNFYPFDCIYQKLYQYAEHIGGPLVNKLSEAVLNKQLFILSENDQYLFNLVNEVCISSVIYSHISFQQAHIMLLKIALIAGQYDDVISKIKHLMSDDFKQTKCSQRELFLLLGVCYEQKLDYDMATQWYVKAQKIRYDDDTDQRDKLMLLAETACRRVASSKKECVKKNKTVHASEREDVYGSVALAQKDITITPLNVGYEGEEQKGIAKDQIKQQAFLCMIKGQAAQKDGKFSEAQTYYREYLSFACSAARNAATGIDHIKIYDLFYQLAHMIINQDVMAQAVNKILFTEDDVTSLFDFNYLDLLNDIYSETVKYSPLAHFNLMFIAILVKKYDAAIERIKIVLDTKIVDARFSTRDLHYICGKIHELKADSVRAKAYYKVSGSSACYPDDKESFSIVRTASTSRLKKIIEDELLCQLSSNRSLGETKEGTNPNRLFSERRQIPVADQNCAAIQPSEISINTMDGPDCSC